jgi:hypothetical protein
MKRRWLGCDVGAASIGIVRRRLLALEPPASFRIATVSEPGATPTAGDSSAEPRATVEVHREADGLRLELTGLAAAATSLRGAAQPLDWTESIDAWMVDFAPDGEVFAPTFVAHRGKGGTVPRETPVVARSRLGSHAEVVVHTVYGSVARLSVPLEDNR